MDGTSSGTSHKQTLHGPIRGNSSCTSPRSSAASLVGVTLAIHLAGLGFSVTQIGALIGTGLAGSALATVVVSIRGDTWGRRRVLVGLTVLTAVGYIALAAFTSVLALIPLAFVGMLNGMGRDRGAAPALEQAILPETVPDEHRTWTLAWYNVLLECGHALGALGATIPTVLEGTRSPFPGATPMPIVNFRRSGRRSLCSSAVRV